MNPKVSNWIIDYLIRQQVDDDMLDRFIASLPLDDVDFGVKKGLVVRRIQSELSKGVVSDKILDLLELVVEMDFGEEMLPSQAMITAYYAVTLDCTVRFLEVDDNSMYAEALQRIWKDRGKKMESFGLITRNYWSRRGDLEAAICNVELRDKILSRNTRYGALKAVRGYITEAWNELGPSFLEKIAEDVYTAGKDGQGIHPHVEKRGVGNVTEAGKGKNVLVNEQGVTGLENVTGDGKGDSDLEEVQGFETLKELVDEYNKESSSDTPSAEPQGIEGLQNVSKARKGDHAAEKEHGLEGLQNVIEIHDEATPCNRPSAGKKDNAVEIEQGLDGLENVNEARDGLAPGRRHCAETQHKQVPSSQNHVGIQRKISYVGGTKAKLSNTEELDADPNKNKDRCLSTPKVNQTRADLQSSFADLNSVVKDPLPEALKTAEGVSAAVQKDTGAGGNCVTEINVDPIPTDDRDHMGANNIRDGGQPEREERGDDNQSMTSDPVEFTHESSPKRRRMAPVTITTPRSMKAEQRRQPRKWSASEEDMLRQGVKEFGKGNWKIILKVHSNVFEGRTEVDLKDKWRNLTRFHK